MSDNLQNGFFDLAYSLSLYNAKNYLACERVASKPNTVEKDFGEDLNQR